MGFIHDCLKDKLRHKLIAIHAEEVIRLMDLVDKAEPSRQKARLLMDKAIRHNRLIGDLMARKIDMYFYMLSNNRDLYIEEVEVWYEQACKRLGKEYLPAIKETTGGDKELTMEGFQFNERTFIK